MKNTIYFIVIIVCVGLIGYGLTRPKASPIAPAANTAGQAPASNAGSTATPQNQAPVAIGQVAQRYRPDTAEPTVATENTASAADIAERNFQITPDLSARMYLIDTYKPGLCYGAPSAVPQVAIDGLVSDNPPLSNFLKQKYGLMTDAEIYNKLKQLQAITLTEIASSKYKFAFMDGQCQTVTYYEGAVTVSGNSVSAIVSSQTSHTYQ